MDKSLAYARHYPAINWLKVTVVTLKYYQTGYEDNVAEDCITLRNKMLELMYEAHYRKWLCWLGDVLPDDQRWVLEIAKIIKVGYLQQNAYNKVVDLCAAGKTICHVKGD